LTDTKLTYYTDQDRLNPKGEIILVGSSASPSTTRANTKKAYYFNINHPACGVRELYAKNSVRRNQWIDKINEVIAEIEYAGAHHGKLYKQGGYSKNMWQERWSLCVGSCLYYYENPSDTSPKGLIGLMETYASVTI